jgi:hypothetical protein
MRSGFQLAALVATGILALFSQETIAQDCNGNGIADYLEIQTGRGFDENQDGHLDECAQPQPWPRVRMMSVFAGLSISDGTTTWDTRAGNNYFNLYFQRDGWPGFVNGSWGLDDAEFALRPGTTTLYFSMQRDIGGGGVAFSLWFDATVVPDITVTSGAPAPSYAGTVTSPYSNNWVAGAGRASVTRNGWIVAVSSFSGLQGGTTGDVVGYYGIGPNGAADYFATAVIEVIPAVDTDSDGIPDQQDNCPLLANPSQADCDSDSVGDVCEIQSGARDVNQNGVPDVCDCSQGADCDNDGVPDSCEIMNGAFDYNGNGIPDTCECIADLFIDGQVNGADLGILLSQWGAATATTVSDLNRDGQVNGADLGYLLASWGVCTK